MDDVEGFFAERAAFTRRRVGEFQGALAAELREPELVGESTFIYATGSGARGELSKHSDLDLFIVRDGKRTRRDEALIQASIIRALRETGFPAPSRDGEFLHMHEAATVLDQMGEPADDTLNTFTARMLLLLESAPVAGPDAHARFRERVIEAYWRNKQEHAHDYQPIILVNDIVRYWRIVLLNYEALNTAQRAKEDVPIADRRLRSYKLRFSRCLTCYSALTNLLALARKGKVLRDETLEMTTRTPLDRLGWLAQQAPEAAPLVGELRELYAEFLRNTDRAKADLLVDFAQDEFKSARSKEATRFGETMFRLVNALGEDNRLFRYVVV